MKKFKNISILFAAPLMVTPLFSVSCGGYSYKDIAQQLKATILTEFKEICKHPHPSWHIKPIYDYLIQRIKELGYEPQHDNFGQKEGFGDYGNIWYDIPASSGCENWNKVIIQGHTDMVYAGSTPDQGITPEEETIFDPKTQTDQKVMHSKDHATSLGADDGIGIATMLAITQNKSLKHGPIRFIMTGDEEDGAYGAHDISADVFDANYLLNVDGEIDCGLAIGCYGTCSYKFNKDFNIVNTTLTNKFRVSIQGFHGGHSGEDVGFRYGNAERFLWELLFELNGNSNNIELSSIDHKVDGKELIYQSNALIPNAGFTFATNKNDSDITTAFNTVVNRWKTKYSGENWDVLKNNLKIETLSFDKSYNAEDSSKLINVFGNDNQEHGFPCGLINCLDETKHVPGASGNIGPSLMNASNSANFTSSVLGRSYLTADILKFANQDDKSISNDINVKQSYIDLWKNAIGSEDGANFQSRCFAWESKEVNPLRDILVKGYKDIASKEANLVSLYGVLEQSEFIEKKGDLTMVTIGPRIENCHTQNETLYIDSMDAELDAIVYCLSNFDQLSQ